MKKENLQLKLYGVSFKWITKVSEFLGASGAVALRFHIKYMCYSYWLHTRVHTHGSVFTKYTLFSKVLAITIVQSDTGYGCALPII